MKSFLMKSWKAQAIRESPTTQVWQTRRRVYIDGKQWLKCNDAPDCFVHRTTDAHYVVKPRYHAGEVVYIKEAWRVMENDDQLSPSEISSLYANLVQYKGDDNSHDPTNCILGKWRSPLFMPAWAARTFVHIDKVEAKRTKDITPEECLMEGIYRMFIEGGYSWPDGIGTPLYPSPQAAYFDLYDSINGPGAHEKNWDWVYTMHRVERPEK